jgi:hypothetical protein
MSLRIVLIVALVAGLASVALNLVKVRDKITTLITERDDWKSKFTKTDAELRTTKSNLETATKKLKETETELASTKDERDKAVAEAEAQKKQAAGLADQLRKTKEALDDAQARLAAWDALGIQPEQIKEVLAQLKQAQKEREDSDRKLRLLTFQYGKATNELARYMTEGGYVAPLPPDLKAKVVVVDPKWDFIVIDVGQDQGALEDGQMLVSRNGKLVAKVRIRSVDRDRSIANVVPGWKLSDIMEGDLVVVP